jgi:lambda family phage portal protein
LDVAQLTEWQKSKAESPQAASDFAAPYKGARVTKLNDHFMPSHVSGNRAIKDSWNLLTARVRDLVRNDPTLSKCRRALNQIVIGTGLKCYSAVTDLATSENEDLEQFEIESDTWFERWAEEEADAEGEHSFFEMQAQAFGDEVEVGNAIWLRVIDNRPGRTVPLSYQVLEWEQMDVTMDRDAEVSRSGKGRRYNRIMNGIEFNSRGQKVAYHIYDAHPYEQSGWWTSDSTRVPADRILHQYMPTRPSAKLGVSWFAPLTQTNKDFDSLVANELTVRAIIALMAVQVKSSEQDLDDGLGDQDPDTGVRNFKLGYPQIAHTGLTDEIEVIESKRSTADSSALQNLILNLHAMGMGISMNRLLGDPTKANLASLKAAHQDDYDMAAPIQNNIARKVVRHARREHMRWAFANGLFRSVSAADYERRPWQFHEFCTVPSGRSDLDKDDGEAAIDRMRSGLSDFQSESARRGYHWRRRIRRIKRVSDYADRYGVFAPAILDWTKGQGASLASVTAEGSQEEEEQNADR